MEHFAPLPSLLALVACAPLGLADPEPPVPGADRVVIEHDTSGEGWLATWELVEPARELRFDRPAGGFRSRIFEVLTPGFRMELDEGIEVLRTDGAPARQISVRFPEYDQQLRREYAFFRVFTDGGVAIYTGHLVARPVGGGAERPYSRDFRFVPPPGAAIVAHGERHAGPIELTTGEQGTYVYVGSAVPVISEDLIAIVDPGLPRWIAERTRRALPRLFALYRERFGAEPSTRPTVLFDFKEGHPLDTSHGGGTLPGMIQLGVEGTGWREPSQPALVQLLHFLAHEAAHIWNGEIVRYPGEVDAWMHEGSADAMADRALLDMGVIDSSAFLDRQTAALNACRGELVVTSLRESLSQGRPRMAYTCGNTLALLTEAALRPHGSDLFDFWRALIRRATTRRGEYDAEDYVAVWRELGTDTADLVVLGRFLDGTANPASLVDALEARGVDVQEAEPSSEYALGYAREAMARLMAGDCGGRIGFRSTAEGFVLDPDVSCGSLVPGARVLAIGGHPLAGEGHAAYDAAREACDSGAAVGLLLEPPTEAAREVDITCDSALPPRPPYVRILSMGFRG